MKKLLFIFCITSSFVSNAQNCLVLDNPSYPPTAYPALPNSLPTPHPITVYNLFFHILTDDDGNRPTPVSEDDILESVKNLNIHFSQFNIYFKYRGYRILKTTAFLTVDQWEDDINHTHPLSFELMMDYSNSIPYCDDTCINIYIPENIIGNGNPLGFSKHHSAWVIAEAEALQRKIIVHEMGHAFDLYHTNQNPLCFENVSTGPDDFHFNSDICGDFVADTPARPQATQLSDITGCVWHGVLQDYYVPPQYYPPFHFDNLMDQRWPEECEDQLEFTPGQGERMWHDIQNDNEFTHRNCETDVSSLYEPFDAQVIAGDVISVTDDPENGGAIVCRNQIYRLRFQPGINYKFYDVENGPIAVDQTEQFNYDNEFDHAIGVKITDISENTLPTGVISSSLSHVCNFESYVTGVLLSTEVLGSMNITVEDLSRVRVSDPHLFESLLSQYYYQLDKCTASGQHVTLNFYKL